MLSRAIVELYAHEVVADRLAFRSGTALHKLFFDAPARFSEQLIARLPGEPWKGSAET